MVAMSTTNESLSAKVDEGERVDQRQGCGIITAPGQSAGIRLIKINGARDAGERIIWNSFYAIIKLVSTDSVAPSGLGFFV